MTKNGSIGHSGADAEVTTLMYYSSNTKVGMILYTNIESINKELMEQFMAIWKIGGKYARPLTDNQKQAGQK